MLFTLYAASAFVVVGALAVSRPAPAATSWRVDLGRFDTFDGSVGMFRYDDVLGVFVPPPFSRPGAPSTFVALDASSGRVRWRKAGVISSRVLVDAANGAFLDAAAVASFDARTGAQRWTSNGTVRGPCEAIVAGGAFVVDDSCGGTQFNRYAFNTTSGALLRVVPQTSLSSISFITASAAWIVFASFYGGAGLLINATSLVAGGGVAGNTWYAALEPSRVVSCGGERALAQTAPSGGIVWQTNLTLVAAARGGGHCDASSRATRVAPVLGGAAVLPRVTPASVIALDVGSGATRWLLSGFALNASNALRYPCRVAPHAPYLVLFEVDAASGRVLYGWHAIDASRGVVKRSVALPSPVPLMFTEDGGLARPQCLGARSKSGAAVVAYVVTGAGGGNTTLFAAY